MCFLFHKWGKWEQYEEKGSQAFGILAPKSLQGKLFYYSRLRQFRICLICNKRQDIRVKDNNEI